MRISPDNDSIPDWWRIPRYSPVFFARSVHGLPFANFPSREGKMIAVVLLIVIGCLGWFVIRC